MVMVHAAATWNPFEDSHNRQSLAYVVSGLGGLAAPLFVTLFGWGIVRSQMNLKPRVFQASFLFTAQVLVNLTSPHLFNPFTPGILSLMGLLTLILPFFAPKFKASNIQLLLVTTVSFFTLQILFPELQGMGEWSDRVSDDSAYSSIGSNVLLTGTYPLFPWIVFALLGAQPFRFEAPFDPEAKHFRRHRFTYSALVLGVGLLFCLCDISCIQTVRTTTLWAHPTAGCLL